MGQFSTEVGMDTTDRESVMREEVLCLRMDFKPSSTEGRIATLTATASESCINRRIMLNNACNNVFCILSTV